jgi:tRNA nucleotidyltransferase (CCA-adding enzyme)
MQLASRFELTAAPETVALCRRMKAEFTTLAKERVREEWIKWAARSRRPSLGLRLLEATEWLEHFPELRALVGTPQDPEWHPEGDVFTHTCHCCDALVDLPGWRAADEESRVVYMLAVLAHDFAKPATTHQAWRDERWRLVSPGHEEAGGPLCERFLERLDLPLHWRRRVLPLVTHHLAHLQPLTDRAVRRLALRLEPESIEGLCLVMTADHHGRPPKPREAPASVRELLERAAALRLAAAAPRPLLQGRHLLELGLSPGPHLGRILKAAFEAQLEGAFADLEGARRWFLERRQDFELAERSRPS